MNRILVLFAHPAFQRSRANRHLVSAVRDLDGVTFRDLYEIYPDFNIDITAEQALLAKHDVVVFHHPFYWYSSPALLKEWQDLVLEYGFAYGDGGTALRGKSLLTVITTGGSLEAYQHGGHNHFEIGELLAPFKQTASLCGMRYLPPFVLHRANQLSEDVLMRYGAQYRAAIEGLRNGTLRLDDLDDRAYLSDAVEGDHHA